MAAVGVVGGAGFMATVGPGPSAVRQEEALPRDAAARLFPSRADAAPAAPAVREVSTPERSFERNVNVRRLGLTGVPLASIPDEPSAASNATAPAATPANAVAAEKPPAADPLAEPPEGPILDRPRKALARKELQRAGDGLFGFGGGGPGPGAPAAAPAPEPILAGAGPASPAAVAAGRAVADRLRRSFLQSGGVPLAASRPGGAGNRSRSDAAGRPGAGETLAAAGTVGAGAGAASGALQGPAFPMTSGAGLVGNGKAVDEGDVPPGTGRSGYATKRDLEARRRILLQLEEQIHQESIEPTAVLAQDMLTPYASNLQTALEELGAVRAGKAYPPEDRCGGHGPCFETANGFLLLPSEDARAQLDILLPGLRGARADVGGAAACLQRFRDEANPPYDRDWAAACATPARAPVRNRSSFLGGIKLVERTLIAQMGAPAAAALGYSGRGAAALAVGPFAGLPADKQRESEELLEKVDFSRDAVKERNADIRRIFLPDGPKQFQLVETTRRTDQLLDDARASIARLSGAESADVKSEQFVEALRNLLLTPPAMEDTRRALQELKANAED